jgi:monofunctional biosynthetic peptidoglycan transglycosylase
MPVAERRGVLRRLGSLALKLALLLVASSVLLTLALRWIAPPASAFMIQHRLGNPQAPLVHWWVPWEQISAHAPLAVVAAEDQKFPVHWGFDVASIQAAVDERADGARLRGASTITQQVAKNLFLWPQQSFVRKGIEAWFSVLIELLWPKQRILEVYLNIAQFGPGIYGVGAASEAYFDKPPAGLSPAEAALLAAVLPNPQRLSVAQPSAFVRERQAWILAQMRGLGGPAYVNDM